MVAIEENAYKDITEGAKSSKINKVSVRIEIYLKEEQNMKAYQETLNTKIENIDKIGNIHKHHKTPQRKIYEVIQQELF